MENIDPKTVEGFGDEWSRFDQDPLLAGDQRATFDLYFEVFPWSNLRPHAVGFDAGCGSGRWARLVAPRVERLHCIDASERALAVARKNLVHASNVEFHHTSVQELPFPDGSMDFGYSLGVLHHIPDTQAALRACVRKLKPGAPFLLYLYYAFDNRPSWFRAVWRASDAVRRVISRMPHGPRSVTSQALAATVYWPLARGALLLESLGTSVEHIPLSAYRNRSFYEMRTDALDRFGTRLEQRFTRQQVNTMMLDAGLENIRFSEKAFWVAVGERPS